MANGNDSISVEDIDVIDQDSIQQEDPTPTDPTERSGISVEDIDDISLREPSGRAQRSSFQGTITNADRTSMTPEELYDATPAQIMRNRAREQSTVGQFTRSVGNLVPNIALGLIENVGYLGELANYGMKELADEEYKSNFSNALTEFAKRHRNPLGEVYQEDPGDITDFDDPAWWINNGFGLVESIGEFLATGAGVGKIASTGVGMLANSINNTMKASRAVNVGANLASQGITASSLGYVEGAISASEVFKETYDQVYRETNDPEFATQEASEAAATTAKTNTMLIGALNMTSVYPLFKSTNLIRRAEQYGISRGASETTESFLGRLDDYIAKGGEAPRRGLYERFAVPIESVQESFEEVANLYSEVTGKQVAGIADTEETGLGLYTELLFSEEGMLNAVLGALGGAGQTLGLRHIPFHRQVQGEGEEASVQWLSNSQMEKVQTADAGINYAKQLKDDLVAVNEAQKKLKQAAQDGNDIAVEEAKRELFDVTLRRSIYLDGGESLKQTLSEIAGIDNEQDLGVQRNEEIAAMEEALVQAKEQGDPEQVAAITEELKQLRTTRDQVAGQTQAMLLGLATSPEDNAYKETAREKLKEVDELAQDFQDTLAKYNYGDEQALHMGERVFDLKLRRRRAGDLIKHYKNLAQDIRTQIDDTTEIVDSEKGQQVSRIIDSYSKLEATRKQLEATQAELKSIKSNLDNLKNKYGQQTKGGVEKALNSKIKNLESNLVASVRDYAESRAEYEGTEDFDPTDSTVTEKIAEEINKNYELQQTLEQVYEVTEDLSGTYEELSRRYNTVTSTQGRKEFVQTAFKEFQKEQKQAEKARKARDAEEGKDKAKLEQDEAEELKRQAEEHKKEGKVYAAIAKAKTQEELDTIAEENDLNQGLQNALDRRRLELREDKQESEVQQPEPEYDEEQLRESTELTDLVGETGEDVIQDGESVNTVDESHELQEKYEEATKEKQEIEIERRDIKAVGSNKVQYGPVRDYIENIVNGKVFRRDASSNKREDYFKLLESDRIDWGEIPLTLVPDTEYEGTRYTDTGEEIESTYAEAREEGIYNAPVKIIAFIDGNEVDLGYLPELSWVERQDAEGNYVNIAEVTHDSGDSEVKNIERQISRIKKIREKVFDNFESRGEATETTSEARTSGRLTLNYQVAEDGSLVNNNQGHPKVQLDTAEKLLPESGLKIGVVRQGVVEFRKGQPQDDFLNSVEDYRNGTIVVQIKDIVIPLWIDSLTENQANTVLSAILAKSQNNEDLIDQINDITFNSEYNSFSFKANSGLANFLETIVFSESFSEKEILDPKTPLDRVFFHVSEKTGHVSIGKAADGVILTTDPSKYEKEGIYQPLEEFQEEALSYIKELSFSTKLETFGKNQLLNSNDAFTEVTIEAGEVNSVTHDNYNKYAKQYLKTYIDGRNTINHGTEENPDLEYVYFEQPVIYFDDSFIGEEPSQTEIVEPKKPSTEETETVTEEETQSEITEEPVQEEGVLENTEDESSIKDLNDPVETEFSEDQLFDSSDTELKSGSVVKYKGKTFLVWNVNDSNKVQLINPDGSKFSGTPNASSVNVTGSYKTIEHNGTEYIVTKKGNIYSTATGKNVYQGDDGNSIAQRQKIYDKVNLTQEPEVEQTEITEESVGGIEFAESGLTVEQQQAVEDIQEFIEIGDPSEHFILEGKAGTGKTTAIQTIIDQNPDAKIIVSALSNKAKQVIERSIQDDEGKLPKNVETSTIAQLLGMKEQQDGSFRPDDRVIPKIIGQNIVIVDEASMINEETLGYIKDKKQGQAKVIYMGDTGQLPPIRKDRSPHEGKDSPVFDEQDNKYQLLTRIRQGEESPILPYADLYWNNTHADKSVLNPVSQEDRKSIISDEGNLIFTNEAIAKEKALEEFRKATEEGDPNRVKVISYRNAKRNAINSYIHNEIFGEDVPYGENEIVMFYNHWSPVRDADPLFYNSDETVVKEYREITKEVEGIEFEAYELTVIREVPGSDNVEEIVPVLKDNQKAKFNKLIEKLKQRALSSRGRERGRNWAMYYEARDRQFADLDYAYAITSHKAQGSTYNTAIVLEDDITSVKPIENKEKSQSLYTAITRARNNVIIASNRNPEQLSDFNLIQPEERELLPQQSTIDENIQEAEQTEIIEREEDDPYYIPDEELGGGIEGEQESFRDDDVDYFPVSKDEITTQRYVNKELQEKLDRYTIAGFSGEQQYQITDTILFLIGKELDTKKPSVELFQDAFNKFKEQLNIERKKGNTTIAGHYRRVLDNWSAFEQQAKDRLEVMGYKLGVEEAYEAEDSNYEKTKFEDKARWLQDSKDTASSQFKMFLAFIPDQEYVGEGETKTLVNKKNWLGLNVYIPFDEVYEEITQLLAGTKPSFNNYISLLETAGEENPHFANIAKKLQEKGDDSTLPSEFVVAMSKQHIGSQLVLLNKRDKDGVHVGYDLKPINSDRNSAISVITNQWEENMKQSKVVTTNEEGELVIDIDYVQELKDNYYKLAEENSPGSSVMRSAFADLLADIGVDLHPKALRLVNSKSTKILGQRWSKAIYPFHSQKVGSVNRTNFVNILFDSLLSNEENPLYSLNSPMVNGDLASRFRGMASRQYLYTPRIYSNSFTNVEGQQVYSYQMNSFLSHKVRRLEDKEYRNQLAKLSFTEDSLWLKDLEQDGQAIQLEYVDGLKKQGTREGNSIENLSKADLDLLAASFFFGTVNQTKGRQGRYLATTKSDKTTTPVLKAPRRSVGIEIEDGAVSNLSGETMRYLKSIVNAELKRIIRYQDKYEQAFKDQGYKLKDYQKGATNFFLLPYLNYNGMQQAVEDGIITQQQLDTVYPGETLVANKSTLPILMEVVKARTLEEINSTYDEWVASGIITDEGPPFIDYGYLTYQTRSYKGDNAIRYAVADFTINNIIANAEQYRLISGDPAQYWKRNIPTTLENIQKRLAKDIAPKSDNDWTKQERTFNKVTLVDPVVESQQAGLPSEYYKGMEIADAQEFTTLEEHLRMMRSWGKITPAKYKELVSKIKKGKDYSFTDEELDIILQPQKPVYVHDKVIPELDINQTIYTKSSSYPLLPQFLKGSELDKLRKAMETQNIQRAAFGTADKLGAVNPVSIFDGRNIKDNLDFSGSIQSLSREGLGLQQEIPVKEKSEIKVVSQMNKLLFSGMRDVKGFKFLGKSFDGRSLEKHKTQIRKALFDISRNELFNKLGIEEDQGDIKLTDLSKIRDILKAEAKSRGWSINDIESLELSEDGKSFILPLSLSGNSKKIESLILSIISNVVTGQTVKGKAYVQGTSAGIKIQEDTKAKGIIYTDKYDPERGLKFISDNKKENRVEAAQVFVPFDFKDNEGNDLDINDFVDEDGVIDSSKLPEEVLRMIGARIPNQGHSSMLPIEIAGFIPKEMGDLIIVPEEIVTQMGSDFDIDKLYTYQTDYTYNSEKGVIEKLTLPYENLNTLYEELFSDNLKEAPDKDEFIDGGIDNIYQHLPKKQLSQLYVDIHWSVLTHREAFGPLTSPLDKPDLTQEKKIINKKKGIEKDVPDSPLNYRVQRTGRVLQRSGQQLVGVFALMNTFNAVIEDTQKADLQLIRNEEGEKIPITIDFKTKGGNLIELSTLSGKGTTKYAGETRTKQENISSLLTAAVDNANLNVAGFINLNTHTAGVAGVMALLQTPDTAKRSGNALSLDYITRFLSQEAVELYVEEVQRLQSSFRDEFTSNVEQIALSNVRDTLLSRAREAAEKDLPEPLRVAFSSEDLLGMINPENKTTDYYMHQISVLNTFSDLLNIAEDLRVVQQAVLSPGTGGAGTTIFELFQKLDFKESLGTSFNIDNTRDLLHGRDPETEEVVYTEQGYASENTVTLGKKIVDKLFPEVTAAYDSVFNVSKIVATTDGALSRKSMERLWDGTKGYLYSRDENLESERDRLLYDKKDSPSLANRIREAKSSWGSDNYFLQRIETRLGEKAGDPSYIVFQASKGIRLDDSNNSRALASMLVSPEARQRNLAEDIIKYSYLVTGGRQTAISFARYIPPQYLEHTGFTNFLHENALDIIKTFPYRITKQALQHNPFMAPSIEDYQMLGKKEEKGVVTGFYLPNFEEADERTSSLIKIVEGAPVYPRFFSVRDQDNNKWILYEMSIKEDGNWYYRQIDTLGSTEMVEYNPETEEVRSRFEDNQSAEIITDQNNPPNEEPAKTAKEKNTSAGVNKLLDYFPDGETGIDDIMASLDKIDDNKYYKTLSTVVKKSLKGRDDIRLVIEPTDKFIGQVSSDGRVLTLGAWSLNNASERYIEEVLLHEYFHLITSNTINTYLKTPEKLSSKEQEIMRSLEVVFKRARRTLTKGREEEFSKFVNEINKAKNEGIAPETLTDTHMKWYALINMKEFVSEIMTNPDFQEEMNKIQFSTDGRSIKARVLQLVTQLLDAIAASFGITINPGTALEQALTDIVELSTLPTVDPSQEANTTNILDSFAPSRGKKIDKSIEKVIQKIESRISRVKDSISNTRDKERKDNYIQSLERLQEDKNILLAKASIEGLGEVIDRQIDWANKVAKRRDISISDLVTALQIVDGWDYSVTSEYLNRMQLVGDKVNPVNETFLEASKKAEFARLKLLNTARGMIAERVNKRLSPDRYITSKDLTLMEDIGLSKEFLFDLSVVDNELAKYIDERLKDASRTMASHLRQWDSEISKAMDWVNGDASFMFQSDEEGSPTGRVIHRYSAKYDELKGGIYSAYNNAIKNAQQYSPSKASNIINKAAKKFHEETNKIEETIDLRFFVIDGFGDYRFKNRKEYVAHLEEEYGKDLANDLMQQAIAQYRHYEGEREAYIESLEADEAMSDESIDKEARIAAWERENSPIRSLEEKFGIPGEKITEYNNKRGHEYLIVVPRKTVKGKSTGFYDSMYESLTEDQKKFHSFYMGLIQEMSKYLPTYVSRQIPQNFLPEITKDFVESMQRNGLSGAASYLNTRMVDSITIGTPAELNQEALKSYEEVDPNTGQPRKRIPINFIGMNLDPDDQSFNLDKIMRMFVGMAVNYKFKSAIEDEVNLAFRIIKESSEKSQRGGKKLVDRFGELVVNRDGVVSLNEAVEYAIDSMVYGKKRDAYKESKFKVMDGWNLPENHRKRRRMKEIELERDNIEKQFDDNTISKEDRDTRMEKLEKEYRELGGKNLVWSKVGDKILEFTQIKGMGYNITAGIANVGFGFLSNVTWAASGKDFTGKELTQALGLIMRSWGSRHGNNKIAHLIKKFDLLFEVTEVEYGKSADRKARTESRTYNMISNYLSPYEIQRRTEYTVQGMSAVAQMLKRKITVTEKETGNEVEISLFEAFNEQGDWSDKYEQLEEWNDTIEPGESNEFTKFRNKVIQLNKYLHGNYDPNSPIKAKKYLLGRMMFQYRSWIPYGFAQRFSPQYYDNLMGREFKGRYRSFKDVGLFNSLKSLFGQMVMNDELAFGKKGTEERFDEIDIENLKMNLREIQMLIGFMTIGILAKAGLDADDEEDPVYWTAMVLINQLYRVEQDIYFYISPATFEDILRNPIPVMRTYRDFRNALDATLNFIMDEDYTGSELTKRWAQALPVGNQVIKMSYLAQNSLRDQY